MESFAVISIITIALVYAGINLFGALTGFGRGSWNEDKKNRPVTKIPGKRILRKVH